VQYIISGNEKVLWQNANVGMKAEEYNEKEDCLLWKVSNPVSFCINAGMFCVFFPDDLHCASLSDGKLVNVKKAVFKIAIN
jgi:YhcH/YjgK/YiaL family protein